MNRGSAGSSMQLKQRYLAALQEHLEGGSRASLKKAGTLGRQAAAEGLEPSALARIHKQTLMTAVLPSGLSRSIDGQISRAATFFMEALAPIVNAHRSTVDGDVARNGRLNRLEEMVRGRTGELAEARRQLKRELALRKVLEGKLEKSDRHHAQLLKKSHQMQDHLRRLSHEIISAQEQERRRISRELHDEIGQTLTAINVRLVTLKKEATVSARAFKKTISSTQRLVERSMNRVHRFARELRPPLLDDLGLNPALQTHLEAFTKRMSIPVRFKTYAAVEELDGDMRLVLYRVAQEALANIAKHAKASRVSVTIGRHENCIQMEIHDNGKSFDVKGLMRATRITRLGLLGMRERLEMVGGRFEVDSEPHKGTTIRAQVPIQGREGSRRARGRVSRP